ncbi:MAG: hypothetical protein CMP14_06230 [Rickettsiales bacterium]|nr:hypothetical protein [Rickettsiales bacterium]
MSNKDWNWCGVQLKSKINSISIPHESFFFNCDFNNAYNLRTNETSSTILSEFWILRLGMKMQFLKTFRHNYFDRLF